MAKMRLKDQVRLPDGRVVTIADELDAGRATVSKSERFHSPRSELGYRTAYFADFGETETGGQWCVEISKTAYESRMGLPISLVS